MNWLLYIILLVIFLYIGYFIVYNSRPIINKITGRKDMASIDSNDINARGEKPSDGNIIGMESDEDIVKTKSIEDYYKKDKLDSLPPSKQKEEGTIKLSPVSRTRCLSTDLPITNIPMNYASQSKSHLR